MKKTVIALLAVLTGLAVAFPAHALEADGSGIPKDEPVSTAGTLYGYAGAFDVDTAIPGQVEVSEGFNEINSEQRIFWEGPVILSSADASILVRDSYIRGETAAETVPLSGSLLVSGNIRTTLATESSTGVYVNSTIASRNWSSLSTDSAKPVLQEGEKELSVYAYGSEAITMDGGYGAFSDQYCNLFCYGSHIQAAEIGIVSGAYGRVTIGNIEDGEADPVLAEMLLQEDMDKRSDKQLPSLVEGGRNALMIHSYSSEEASQLSASVTAGHSVLRSNLALDKHVQYEPQQQAYIDHTAGSVILIKSTDSDIILEDCDVISDPDGTRCLVQTVIHNDTMSMNAVPDGETYPGIHITMRGVTATGDIAHEDYQRDLLLTLEASELDGSMNEYDCSHWDQAGAEEGFSEYCPDDIYQTHHGLSVIMQAGSYWNVREESHLSRLEIGPDCMVNGIILVDGQEQGNVPGTVYEGQVVVIPKGTDPETETQTETPAQNNPEQEQPETTAEHVHIWQRYGGSPGTCTEDGFYGWVCFECGASYKEPIEGSALGHDFVLVSEKLATCEEDGVYTYECSRCGATDYKYTPALGHDLRLKGLIEATCTTPAAEYITCTREGCTYERTDYYGEPLGHLWDICYPTPGEETLHHTIECSRCGESYTAVHEPVSGYCPICGYSGSYGAVSRTRSLFRR